jgi:hypothetical protein
MKQILNALTVLTLVALMSGVAQAVPTTADVPDAGSTASLMALAFGGLTVLRRFVR